MKLAYQQATISFCTDLTSPDGESFPVANLLVGDIEGRQIAGVAVIVPEKLDPISRAVLNDTHQLIRRYVDEAFKSRSPHASLGDVLARVYNSLRNSMHVSSIATRAEVDVEVGGPKQLGGAIINLLHDGLMTSLAEAGLVLKATPPTSWANPSDLGLAPSFVWAPPSPSAVHTAIA
jgi:hypothetical protein